MAAGFSEQQGALFGFGPKAHENTGTLLKISSATDEAKRRKLNRAATHNLKEGEKCEFHQLQDTYTGKQCLESASKKMIINKSIDLLETSEPVEIKKFRKPSKQIKDIKMQRKEKIKAHQDKMHSDKEKSCLKEESTKYDLLGTLKKEDISGPFTCEDEIKIYLLHQVDDAIKNNCMHDKSDMQEFHVCH